MDLEREASELLEPLGYEVLELKVGHKGKSRRLVLRIDRLDEGVVSIEDVATASEVFGLELDRLDPFDGPYQLEVESPGAQRPLRTPRHFQRFHDLMSKVRVGQETFKGLIRGVDGETVTFEIDGETRSYRIDQIDSARLAEWPSSPR